MTPEEEKKLVEQVKLNFDAFNQLYDFYYPKIFGYVLKRMASFEIAQDVTSTTFFKCLKGLKKFKWQGVSFSCWLYKIASHEIANHYRQNKYRLIPLDEAPALTADSNPLEELIEAERQLKNSQEFLRIQEKIKQLPLPYQEVIVLRFFENKKIKEIAQIMNRKQGTIKSMLHRGLKKLRQLMPPT